MTRLAFRFKKGIVFVHRVGADALREALASAGRDTIDGAVYPLPANLEAPSGTTNTGECFVAHDDIFVASNIRI